MVYNQGWCRLHLGPVDSLGLANVNTPDVSKTGGLR